MEIELQILPYQPKYKNDFVTLNLDWLEEYFEVEPYDKKIFQPNNKTNQTYRRQFHPGNDSKTKQLSKWLTESILKLYHEQHIPIVNGISPSNAIQELQKLYKIPVSKSIINAQGYLIPFKAKIIKIYG